MRDVAEAEEADVAEAGSGQRNARGRAAWKSNPIADAYRGFARMSVARRQTCCGELRAPDCELWMAVCRVYVLSRVAGVRRGAPLIQALILNDPRRVEWCERPTMCVGIAGGSKARLPRLGPGRACAGAAAIEGLYTESHAADCVGMQNTWPYKNGR